MGLWNRQDPGTTPGSGSPQDIPGTPSRIVGDRTLGKQRGVGVLGIVQGLLTTHGDLEYIYSLMSNRTSVGKLGHE